MWAAIDCGGSQISLKISASQEGNMINYEVIAFIKLKLNNEQLFLELGPENSLVYSFEQCANLIVSVVIISRFSRFFSINVGH